jgi:hypothetical protein
VMRVSRRARPMLEGLIPLAATPMTVGRKTPMNLEDSSSVAYSGDRAS